MCSVCVCGYVRVVMMLSYSMRTMERWLIDDLNDSVVEGLMIVDKNERANFDNFGWSMVTVFQIIGGENWNQVKRTHPNHPFHWLLSQYHNITISQYHNMTGVIRRNGRHG